MDSCDLKSLLTDARRRLSSPFCCGGSFQPLQPVRLACKKNDAVESEMFSMELPTNDDEIMGKLVAACSEASFGKGTETVYDPTYRKSLKLEPRDFFTSFELHSSQILEEIKQVLAPKADFITAELYNLNLYRPGDFFKPHVDTPRLNSFASLVIILPTAFAGGELVVEHRGHAHCFDWSGDNTDGPMVIHWASFYSDCKHEVKELTSGHRIALTYNLCSHGDKLEREESGAHLKSWIKSSELYSTLCRAKESYRGDGATLGFPCSHLYPLLLHRENSLGHLAEHLKGEDLVLYAAAQSAGLKPRLCRIWQPGHVVDEVVYFVDTDFDGIPTTNHGWYMDDDQNLETLNFLGDRRSDIEWCTLTSFENFDWQVGGAFGSYGNDAMTETLYCIIAILIDFQEQREKRRKLTEDQV